MSNNFEIIGKVLNINKGEDFLNVNIQNRGGEQQNIKVEDISTELIIGRVYKFTGEVVYNELRDKNFNLAHVVEDLSNLDDKEQMYKYYSNFFKSAPVKLEKLTKDIESAINGMKNETIKIITSEIYKRYKDKFYTHPAGTKYHHAYIGGLAYHTATMLDIAKRLLKVYTFLDEDLLIAGVILHDIEKTNEITGVDGEYTVEGLLVGHINMIISTIDEVAKEKGLSGKEEVMCLKHLMLSHHGIPQFGSPKKPQMAEALLLWYIDTIDAKLCVVGEELKTTPHGEFTQNIFVADKSKFYKPNYTRKKK